MKLNQARHSQRQWTGKTRPCLRPELCWTRDLADGSHEDYMGTRVSDRVLWNSCKQTMIHEDCARSRTFCGVLVHSVMFNGTSVQLIPRFGLSFANNVWIYLDHPIKQRQNGIVNPWEICEKPWGPDIISLQGPITASVWVDCCVNVPSSYGGFICNFESCNLAWGEWHLNSYKTRPFVRKLDQAYKEEIIQAPH